MSYRLGIDVGGTFTDFVLSDARGKISVCKVPSTPSDPSLAVVDGLDVLATEVGLDIAEFMAQLGVIVHGTTVTTNAVLTGNGAKTALLTTAGFRDILEMRRGYREELFNNRLAPPEPLVPRPLRLAVRERVDYAGRTLTPLDLTGVANAAAVMQEAGIEAVAVCFMHSYANPAHEQQAGEILAAALPGAYRTLSSELVPQIRLYDRLSTTVLNSYVGPVLSRYLSSLVARLEGLQFNGVLLIMSSSGGVVSPAVAAERAAATLLSGPAAAPVAGGVFSRVQGYTDCITVDMGGTSFDAALVIDGRPLMTNEAWVARQRLALPSLDIHTIGSGGGSIGWIDDGGLLRMGPQSAGAVPGPACYRKGGTLPTCTDADLVLGYLSADHPLGGSLHLDAAAARRAIEQHIAGPLALDLTAAAAGMNRLINVNMATGLREISVRRGVDPRDKPLVAAGGAGPVHAAFIARELEIPIIIAPRHSSLFCAWGMLGSDLKHDFVRTQHTRLSEMNSDQVLALLTEMEEEGRQALMREAVTADKVRIRWEADLRYRGQHNEIGVPFTADDLAGGALAELFHRQHEHLYGYALPVGLDGVEMLNLRVTCLGVTQGPAVSRLPYQGADPAGCLKGQRPAWDHTSAQFLPTPVYAGEAMGYGHRLQGPAIIEQVNTTIVVPPGMGMVVDALGSFCLYEESVADAYLRRVLP